MYSPGNMFILISLDLKLSDINFRHFKIQIYVGFSSRNETPTQSLEIWSPVYSLVLLSTPNTICSAYSFLVHYKTNQQQDYQNNPRFHSAMRSWCPKAFTFRNYCIRHFSHGWDKTHSKSNIRERSLFCLPLQGSSTLQV